MNQADETTQPPSLPPTAAPRGWRRARRPRRLRTLDDDLPALGAKISFFASLLCFVLACAVLLSPGVLVFLQSYDVLRTDLSFVMWQLIVLPPTLILLAVGHAVEPVLQGGRARKAAQRSRTKGAAMSNAPPHSDASMS
jgi:hypothetical protein